MFMVSSGIGSWPLVVILTVRSAVFICGETEVMVPWMMVPGGSVSQSRTRCRVRIRMPCRTGGGDRGRVDGQTSPGSPITKGEGAEHTIFELNGHRLVGAFHQKPGRRTSSARPALF